MRHVVGGYGWVLPVSIYLSIYLTRAILGEDVSFLLGILVRVVIHDTTVHSSGIGRSVHCGHQGDQFDYQFLVLLIQFLAPLVNLGSQLIVLLMDLGSQLGQVRVKSVQLSFNAIIVAGAGVVIPVAVAQQTLATRKVVMGNIGPDPTCLDIMNIFIMNISNHVDSESASSRGSSCKRFQCYNMVLSRWREIDDLVGGPNNNFFAVGGVRARVATVRVRRRHGGRRDTLCCFYETTIRILHWLHFCVECRRS
jgi:hypothetical protein